MPDLLAHAFIAYTIGRILAWHYDWRPATSTTVVMAGAFIPDLTKAKLVASSGTVEHLLNFPFDWGVFHTAGGALVATCIGTIVVAPRERGRVLALLSVGSASHLVADSLLLTPSGRSLALLWPLTRFHPPTPGLYLSTQPGPTLVTGVLAFVVWLLTTDRTTHRPSATHTEKP